MKTMNYIMAIILAIAVNLAMAQEEKEEAPAEKEEDAAPVIEKELPPAPPERIHGSVERVTVPATTKSKMKLLSSHYSEKEGLWIGKNNPFFVLWQADRSGDAKGALLILHGHGEHPSWPQTTYPLHETLPEYGWATLALSLPTPPEKKIPERTLPPKVIIKKQEEKEETEKENSETPQEGEENTAEESDPEKEEVKKEEVKKEIAKKNNTNPKPKPKVQKNTVPFKKQMEERLTAAIKFLHDKGQFNIAILGNGNNAVYAEEFMKSITPQITDRKLKDKFEKPIRALLLYNAGNTILESGEDYSGWFTDPDVPILDIYTRFDRRHVVNSKKRKALSKKKKVTTYVSLQLAEMSHETVWGENQLSRRIRSFLDVHVKGIEVKNAKIKK